MGRMPYASKLKLTEKQLQLMVDDLYKISKTIAVPEYILYE